MKLRTFSGIAAVSLALAMSAPSAQAAQTAAELSSAVQNTIAKCFAEVKTCKELGSKANGMLVFPEVTKAAIGVGGEYGEGALVINGKPVAFYSTSAASLGLQLGAQQRSQVIMFMSEEVLNTFKNSSGWEVGGNAGITVIDPEKSSSVDTTSITDPVVGFIFGEKGLMADLSFKGQKISKIELY